MARQQPPGGEQGARGGGATPQAWLARAETYFPERQIYIRSDGRVQFYTLSRGLQVALAALLTIFLGWVAFSTVTVVFKDRIIAAEDHRFQKAQAAFEAHIADLQISYDDLMGRAANAQTYADRQRAALSQRQDAFLQAANTRQLAGSTANRSLVADSTGDSALRATSANTPFVRALHWLGLGHKTPQPQINYPSLNHLLADVAALKQLSADSNGIMAAIEANTLQEVTGEKALIAQTGINADQFLHKLASVEGVGGPEISLDTIQLDGVSDHAFSEVYFKAEANARELEDLQRAVLRLPTAVPLGIIMERTSGFGPRLDPFTGHYGFHPGIDFAGPTGTAVLATADGVVTSAGRDGGYGNMVEIGHSFGLKTRYAHLLSIAVSKGQRIIKGTIVGRLGSTGRSTGPHVHYEVWFNDVVRNPDGFLRLGQLERSHAF